MNARVPTATCPDSPVVVMPGTAARPKSITTGPSGQKDVAGLEVAVHHADGVHRAQGGQRRDGDAFEHLAWDTVLLDDLHQRRPADVLADDERPAFEDAASSTCAVQNPATCCAAATSFRKRYRTWCVVGARSLTAAGVSLALRAR